MCDHSYPHRVLLIVHYLAKKGRQTAAFLRWFVQCLMMTATMEFVFVVIKVMQFHVAHLG